MKNVITFLLIFALSVAGAILFAKADLCVAGGYFPSCAGYNIVTVLLFSLITTTFYSYFKSKVKIYSMEEENKIKALKRAEAMKIAAAEAAAAAELAEELAYKEREKEREKEQEKKKNMPLSDG